ncbi:MutL C terminal dimerization domain-containing protein [Hygrophoropsis aurantiaca]|uniref:MutL C terminal dimerization domain-containing protein n=1 Tax=Hygrophoropsis aurantiaca TaxID=72124 RepID=A0ACB8A3Q2_9AGAM|nr:MutL C terminal dimerization domain-containing protein [Hygrophoropsis aurantiaca]
MDEDEEIDQLDEQETVDVVSRSRRSGGRNVFHEPEDSPSPPRKTKSTNRIDIVIPLSSGEPAERGKKPTELVSVAGVALAEERPPPDIIDLSADRDHETDVSLTAVNGDDDETGKTTASSRTLPPEIVRRDEPSVVTLRFDLTRVTNTYRLLHSRLSAVSREPVGSGGDMEIDPPDPSTTSVDAGITNAEDGEKAAVALSRIIDKDDFRTMDILGQFNLGFIITRRRKTDSSGPLDDLFIVDQHAADEKYNFETLQQTTVIQSQKLFKPQPLQLTAADELLALENLDILKQNGFEVAQRETDTSGEEHRLELMAQPVSKSTTFDMKDLEEIIHLMQDRPMGTMVRCSKARAMFAMRACRKSVMIGMPLSINQMTSVVQHMGTMVQPWNCPHGRPTMRHLSDLTSFMKVDQVHGRINWASYVPP